MHRHEQYEELIALAGVGQLSAEEHSALMEHLRGCSSCRRAEAQFKTILDELPLPDMDVSDRELRQLESSAYRQHFMDRASREGVQFTPKLLAKSAEPRKLIFNGYWPRFALSMVIAIAIAVVTTTVVIPRYLLFHTVEDLKNVSAPTSLAHTEGAASVSAATAELVQEQLSVLQKDYESQAKLLAATRKDLDEAHRDQQRTATALAASTDQGSRLQADNQQVRQQLAEAVAKAAKLDQDNTQLTASMVAQQYRIRGLSDDVRTQMEAVEREKQLTAAARDVREMMGARNLHIVDVADLDGNGKSRKSFGRVFYVEGRSLIFYAFDLSRKHSASNVAFQAWGQEPGGGTKVINLGIFHVDDQVQKRWVLRVDKPELLSRVESVFVTVEPSGGKDRPSGQKLLYAFLGTPANHP